MMEQEVLEARLRGIEAQLDAIAGRLDAVLKAQVLLCTLTESGQTEARRQLTETLPEDLAAHLGAEISAEMRGLSGKLAEAIGEALGDQTYADLRHRAGPPLPLDVILRDLGLPETTGNADEGEPTAPRSV